MKKFTEEDFINSYVSLIKETQDLPSKPMVYLMVPTFNCQHKFTFQDSSDAKLNEDEWTVNPSECSAAQSKDLQKTIY